MKQKKLQNIANIKTAMMLLVVLYHSCLFFSRNWFTNVMPVYDSNIIVVFSKWLNTFHVPAFVMCSGYLFYYLRYEKGKYRDTKKDLTSRISRLIIPTYLICFIWIVPIYIYFNGQNYTEIFKKFVFLFSPSQLWFMPMLFWLFIFSYHTSDRIPLNFITLVVLTIICVLIGAGLGKLTIAHTWLFSNSFFYLPYFYFGGLLWKYNDSLKNKYSVFAVLFGLVLAWIMEYMSRTGLILKFLAVWANMWFSIFEVYIVYILFTKLTNVCESLYLPTWVKRIFDEMNDNSFGIYLFHQQIIYFCIIWLNGKVMPITQVVVTFLVAVFFSWIIVKVLKMNKNIATMLSL